MANSVDDSVARVSGDRDNCARTQHHDSDSDSNNIPADRKPIDQVSVSDDQAQELLTADKPLCYILDIPTEIRLLILDNLFNSLTSPAPLAIQTNTEIERCTAVIYTCTKMFNDAAEMFERYEMRLANRIDEISRIKWEQARASCVQSRNLEAWLAHSAQHRDREAIRAQRVHNRDHSGERRLMGQIDAWNADQRIRIHSTAMIIVERRKRASFGNEWLWHQSKGTPYQALPFPDLDWQVWTWSLSPAAKQTEHEKASQRRAAVSK